MAPYKTENSTVYTVLEGGNWQILALHFNQFKYELQINNMRWRSWLRHCATSRKVAGSIHDGVIGIFH